MRACLVVGIALVATHPMRGPSCARAASLIQTSVDANGHVLPLPATATRPEVVGKPAAVICGDAVPLAPDAAKTLVARVATEEGFYPDFVISVAKIESHYRSTALSEKGAYGLMQLMPETAQRFGVDLCDPAGNVRGGIRLLRMLHERYKNPFFILAAYNAGEEALLKSRGVPPYPETVRFVADVINDFYAWPVTAPSRSGPAVMAAAQAPGIVEVTPAPDAASPPKPTVAPPWSDGFVMHID
ncbi:lytic transglycosylase domain-containing protein [Lichenifustis flavocetrariae]|uniref:Lytic transglycosylase domain-containing protein n=1 Tax=Lichenifustis flavocetrariae TaxID=2949735 RepID=A0AA41Z1J5_9HYPH|nr:lytic transglycosylase domain-containing protein [Lichenifustis flavocetrariae]MCW6512531.1 lytic transglycosylase domain-containing protein [Lichenifustis flavocetrariae]